MEDGIPTCPLYYVNYGGCNPISGSWPGTRTPDNLVRGLIPFRTQNWVFSSIGWRISEQKRVIRVRRLHKFVWAGGQVRIPL